MGRGGGGGQAAVAKALASQAFPAAEGPDVFGPQPTTPFAQQPATPFLPPITDAGPPPPIPQAREWDIGAQAAANPFGLAPGAGTPVVGPPYAPAAYEGNPQFEAAIRRRLLEELGLA